MFLGGKLVYQGDNENYGWQPPAAAEKHLYGDSDGGGFKEQAPHLFDSDKSDKH
jgi:hypothetical protein